MRRWARLTWQVDEPAAAAARLVARLGLPPLASDPASASPAAAATASGASTPGSFAPIAPGGVLLDLGSAKLEIRPWIRESPGDDPTPGGRLMLEPVPGGEESPEDEEASRAAEAGGMPGRQGREHPLRLAAIGWSTVELDRAEDELGPWLGSPDLAPGGDGAERRNRDAIEPHLGATARVRPAGGLPADAFVLLEPTTEGRLAASLARDGEGPCALYLRPRGGLGAWVRAARARGVTCSTVRSGPLGPSVLVVGGPVAGPHLLVVGAPGRSRRTAAAGTIAP